MGPFLTGLGVAPERVREMDWWERVGVEVEVNVRGKGRVVKRVEVACVPAQHWSARSVASNQSLWASFIVKGEEDSFYHWSVHRFESRRECNVLVADDQTCSWFAAVTLATRKSCSSRSAARSVRSPSLPFLWAPTAPNGTSATNTFRRKVS